MIAILQDLARRRMSSKILQDEWLYCKILESSFRGSSSLMGSYTA